MSTFKNGGSAFPLKGEGEEFMGMTLRDYFAAKCMPEMERGIGPENIEEFYDHIAKKCYKMADAMIKQKNLNSLD